MLQDHFNILYNVNVFHVNLYSFRYRLYVNERASICLCMRVMCIMNKRKFIQFNFVGIILHEEKICCCNLFYFIF